MEFLLQNFAQGSGRNVAEGLSVNIVFLNFLVDLSGQRQRASRAARSTQGRQFDSIKRSKMKSNTLQSFLSCLPVCIFHEAHPFIRPQHLQIKNILAFWTSHVTCLVGDIVSLWRTGSIQRKRWRSELYCCLALGNGGFFACWFFNEVSRNESNIHRLFWLFLLSP